MVEMLQWLGSTVLEHSLIFDGRDMLINISIDNEKPKKITQIKENLLWILYTHMQWIN